MGGSGWGRTPPVEDSQALPTRRGWRMYRAVPRWAVLLLHLHTDAHSLWSPASLRLTRREDFKEKVKLTRQGCAVAGNGEPPQLFTHKLRQLCV